MPALHVRNVDEAVVRQLRDRAARNGRSAEAEHREILKNALSMDARKAAWFEEVDRIRAMTPNVPQTPSEILIREMRDER